MARNRSLLLLIWTYCLHISFHRYHNSNVNNVQICLINFLLMWKKLISDASHEADSSLVIAFRICSFQILQINKKFFLLSGNGSFIVLLMRVFTVKHINQEDKFHQMSFSGNHERGFRKKKISLEFRQPTGVGVYKSNIIPMNHK